MRKHMKRLATFALAAVLAVGMGTTVLAEYAVPKTTGTEEAPATAFITKELQLPSGTDVPNESFAFTVTPKTVDGVDYKEAADGAAANMPSVTPTNISFTSTDTKTETEDENTATKTSHYVKSTEIFKNITWPHAGVYVYEIKETADNTTGMTYSGASYTATVYVKNGTNGTYASDITVVKTKDDAGEDTSAEEQAKKVDPSKPDETDPSKGGGLKFVNKYVKSIPVTPVNPDPDNPTKDDDNDNGLGVKKIVTGELGDKTKGFDFKVKVTAPTLSSKTSYTAKIVEKDSESETPKEVKIVSFTSGTEQTIQLAHGQELVFTDLDVGAAFEVQETDSDVAASDTEKNKYIAKTEKVLNGGTATQEGTGAAKVSGRVSEKSDLVAVTNTRNSETPTGIVINNLPFILMIAAVLGGFAAYIAARRRRS